MWKILIFELVLFGENSNKLPQCVHTWTQATLVSLKVLCTVRPFDAIVDAFCSSIFWNCFFHLLFVQFELFSCCICSICWYCCHILFVHCLLILFIHSVLLFSSVLFVHLGFSLLVWYCCLVLFIHLTCFFIHFGTDVAFCSSICNCFHVLIIHLLFVVTLCSSICNYFHMLSSICLCCRVLFVHVELFSCVIRPFALCCRVLFVHLQLFSCTNHPFGLCCRVLFIHLELFSCAVRPFGLSYRVLSVHLRTIFVLCSSVFAGFSVVGCSSEARDLSTLDVRKFCLSCSALALLALSLSLSPLSLSVSIAVARIFRPSGYDALEEEEFHLKLRDTEKERERKQ